MKISGLLFTQEGQMFQIMTRKCQLYDTADLTLEPHLNKSHYLSKVKYSLNMKQSGHFTVSLEELKGLDLCLEEFKHKRRCRYKGQSYHFYNYSQLRENTTI